MQAHGRQDEWARSAPFSRSTRWGELEHALSAKSRKRPLRGPRNDWVRARYLRARRRLLEVLVERRVVDVDDADQKRLVEMPLGYWEELDGVEEAEWRRILELRNNGWREFTESDRRPWPPVDSD